MSLPVVAAVSTSRGTSSRNLLGVLLFSASTWWQREQMFWAKRRDYPEDRFKTAAESGSSMYHLEEKLWDTESNHPSLALFQSPTLNLLPGKTESR